MNIRSRLLLSFCLPFALLAGCTSYYRNAETCKDKARAEWPGAASAPLTVTGSGSSYHGARVVVRGQFPSAPQPPATKIVQTPAAAECTFSEDTLTGFQWLAPVRFRPKPDSDAAQ